MTPFLLSGPRPLILTRSASEGINALPRWRFGLVWNPLNCDCGPHNKLNVQKPSGESVIYCDMPQPPKKRTGHFDGPLTHRFKRPHNSPVGKPGLRPNGGVGTDPAVDADDRRSGDRSERRDDRVGPNPG